MYLTFYYLRKLPTLLTLYPQLMSTFILKMALILTIIQFLINSYDIINFRIHIYIYIVTRIFMSQQNLQQIFNKAAKNPKYLFQLLDIGRKTGFENFINRKLIWPFLIQLDSKVVRDSPLFQWKGGMDRTSNDFDQLQKDAERSLSSMKTFETITRFHLRKRQEAVLSVLDTFFAKNTDLKYIQGFHDVASIFLILFGNNSGFYLMEKAGRTYFHDFLKYEFGNLGMAISQIIYEIVTKSDKQFEDIYASYQNTKFLIFILPWILTWFAHNFTSVKVICRIWDYLLCTGNHGVFYLTCGIILATKDDLLRQCEQFDEPTIQTFYQEQARKSAIDIEKCIQIAMSLQLKYKIQDTEGYSKLERGSMFRKENFAPLISIHTQYHESREKAKRKKETMSTVIKVGSVVVASAIILISLKYGRSTMASNL